MSSLWKEAKGRLQYLSALRSNIAKSVDTKGEKNMVNFQKLESSVASLEKQLQEVKEQLAEVRNEYQEECHPGKTDIREYILEKATERFGEHYMKPEEDREFFDNFYDAVKRKVKKDSMIMGLRIADVGMVFCDNAVYVFEIQTPFKMQFIVQYDEIEDVDYKRAVLCSIITITVSKAAAENNSSSELSVSLWTNDDDPMSTYKLLLDILEYVNA